MGVRNWNLWKHHAFKSIKYMFSQETRVQMCVFVSETGVVPLERLQLATGYCVSEVDKIAFMVIQKLKMPMQGLDEPVLLISERSHMPLDPLNRLTPEEKAKLQPLKNIARAKHAEKRSQIDDENKQNANHELMKTLVMVVVIATMIIAIAHQIRG